MRYSFDPGCADKATRMTDSSLALDSLTESLERARAKTRFSDIFGNRFGATDVKRFYETNPRCLIGSTDGIQLPARELKRVASDLDGSLGGFRSSTSDAVGNGLYRLTGSGASPRLPSVQDYAKVLVLAASRIGPERVGEIFSAWLRGEPIRLHRCALLRGIKTEERIRAVPGMYLETLPTNVSYLPPSLRIDIHELLRGKFRGRAMLATHYDTEPGLYDPDTVRESFPPEPPRRDLVNRELASLSVEAFCRAMSLAADNQVDWFIQWEDYGDVEAFFLNPGFSCARKEATESSTVHVTAEHLRECLEFHGRLDSFRKLDVAIARWRRSKTSTTFHEQLVELRIALESVLLSDDRGVVGEKRHRLAVRGAWLLGSSFDERKTNFRTLRDLYDYASSIIHAGTPKEKASAPLKETMSEARRLCRLAILRILRGQHQSDWVDLILGRDSC